MTGFFHINQAQEKSSFAGIDIPFQKFVLDNGLTVIIHEDHKAPVVAVNIWYHVGSKNEVPGRTGFAHLFEHLMFNGSEHFNDDYFKALDRIGATDLNGTTSNDRTNYFETVPVSEFEKVLWLESDRMGYMVNAIDQAKLDEQRGVVQNEKRQYENEPYGMADEYITKAVYPAGHPYSWTVIGSMEDLSAASLDDVKGWFKSYYGPNNAVLVVAGDVQTEDALAKVKKHFGGLPSGPPVTRMQAFTARRHGAVRQVMQDRVPQARIYKVWNVPGDGSPEANDLELVTRLLSSGKNSRLYKRLVYEDQISTMVYAYLDSREISSLFTIVADARPGTDISVVEKAIDEELARFIHEGPFIVELERIKVKQYASFIRGLERVGGFGGKSDILAMSQTLFDNPEYYKTYLDHLALVQPAGIRTTAQEWLSDGEYVLTVQPFPEMKTRIADVDRSAMPPSATPPDLSFPKFERAKLSNGLSVILARRNTIPAVNMMLTFNAGYASDAFSSPGTARLAMGMIDEGTDTRSALKISEEIDGLGARLNTGSDLDQSFISLNTLIQNLDPALDILADVVLHPSFPETEIDRLKKEQLATIQREKSQPNGMAFRILPRFLYGESHPYSNPLSGSGYEAGVKDISREQLVKFHETWFKPNNATLVVVGDIQIDELKTRLEKKFGGWKNGPVPDKRIFEVKKSSEPVIYLMNRPGSIQSLIIAGNLTEPFGKLDEAALSLANSIIGGEFTSRINMNIREDKHWSYGASSFVMDATGQRPFMVYTSVQSDKTFEALREIDRELKEFVTLNPATDDEVARNRENKLLQIPGKYETMSSLSNGINQIVHYGLKDTYFEDYARELKTIKTADVRNVTGDIITPSGMVWVVVGDREQIEEPLKKLGYTIHMIDADGNTMD